MGISRSVSPTRPSARGMRTVRYELHSERLRRIRRVRMLSCDTPYLSSRTASYSTGPHVKRVRDKPQGLCTAE